MAGIWPTTLPQAPELTSFTDKPPNNLIRSDMDTGDAKVRRRGQSKAWVASATYYLTGAQLSTLYTFTSDTIADGALCFDWPHPTKSVVRARLRASSESLFESSQIAPDRTKVVLSIEYWPDAPTTS